MVTWLIALIESYIGDSGYLSGYLAWILLPSLLAGGMCGIALGLLVAN